MKTHNLFCTCAQCNKEWASYEKLEARGDRECVNYEDEKELDQLYEKDGWGEES